MKKILYSEACAVQYFFNEHGEYLHSWHENDALYRSEYMSPLFEKLGLLVEYVDWTDYRVRAYIVADLDKNGIEEGDIY
jgi:hypothetical protein